MTPRTAAVSADPGSSTDACSIARRADATAGLRGLDGGVDRGAVRDTIEKDDLVGPEPQRVAVDGVRLLERALQMGREQVVERLLVTQDALDELARQVSIEPGL